MCSPFPNLVNMFLLFDADQILDSYLNKYMQETVDEEKNISRTMKWLLFLYNNDQSLSLIAIVRALVAMISGTRRWSQGFSLVRDSQFE
jgi:hypothetical protein